MWETVSAFANTAGGWIILGIHENKENNVSNFNIVGVDKPEKMEQDLTSTEGKMPGMVLVVVR